MYLKIYIELTKDHGKDHPKSGGEFSLYPCNLNPLNWIVAQQPTNEAAKNQQRISRVEVLYGNRLMKFFRLPFLPYSSRLILYNSTLQC